MLVLTFSKLNEKENEKLCIPVTSPMR